MAFICLYYTKMLIYKCCYDIHVNGLLAKYFEDKIFENEKITA